MIANNNNNNNNNNKPLNKRQIIDEYLDDINDNIIILPSISDANNICKELQSLLTNQPNLTPSVRYILFIDSFEAFINQCIDFAIITDSVVNNDSLRIINLKWNWNIYNGVTSRHLLNANNYSGWIAPTYPLLPRADNSIASSSYNNTIYLFGGWKYQQQFVEFDTISHTFTDHGASSLNLNVYGVGQYYTQQNKQMFYWIDGDSGNEIIIYDLSTQSILQNNIAIPNNVGRESCLASSKTLLFVLGGYAGYTLSTSQIYNISSQTWLSGISSMISSRRRMSCIVHPTYDMIYAIGGENNNNVLKSVENIQINDILINNNWQNIGNLGEGYTITRSIIYGDSVLVFGGDPDCNGCDVSSEIFIINAETNEITSGGNLNYGVGATSAILLNQKIYLFGGWNPDKSIYTDSTLNAWQYFHFITPISTTATASAPTTNPTTATTPESINNPTTSPTPAPTDNPTTDPTPAPTNNPTTDPTPAPTNNPTTDPTSESINNPTTDPTPAPTNNPTTATTDNASNLSYNVTFTLTRESTINPSLNPILNITTAIGEDDDVNGFEESQSLISWWMIYVLLIVIGLLICVILIIMKYLCDLPKKEELQSKDVDLDRKHNMKTNIELAVVENCMNGSIKPEIDGESDRYIVNSISSSSIYNNCVTLGDTTTGFDDGDV